MVEQEFSYGEHEVIVRKVGNRYSISIDGTAPFSVESTVADLERTIRETIATFEGIQRVRRDLDNGTW